MSCSNPSLAVDLGLKENGKRFIKFLPKRIDYDYNYYKSRYGDSLLMLPCGSCEGCILARRKMWSLRCFAESQYHQENCFITLTYDEANCPEKLDKKHFQDFIKGLRNKGIECRYFGCGEYGSGVGHRPHYHIVIFGFFPGDVKFLSNTKSGFPQFTSKFLSSIWNKGFVTVSQFSPEVAGYVAGYVDKKYKVKDSFILMSKRPGLGEQYFKDHYKDIYKHDSIIMKNGSIGSVPKYFDKLAESLGLDLTELKDKRLSQMNFLAHKYMRDLDMTHIEQLLVHRGHEMRDKLNKKKRGL